MRHSSSFRCRFLGGASEEKGNERYTGRSISTSSSTIDIRIVRVVGEAREAREDALAVEEPLDIRLVWGTPSEKRQKSLSITMRTPGDDVALALGFLVAEGIVTSSGDVADAAHCGNSVRDDGTTNIVKVTLAPQRHFDMERLERHFYTSSSCGVCGKTSLEAVRSAPHAPIGLGPRVTPDIVHALPATLQAAQAAFARTGGLHAAGLFDAGGHLIALREDVGRHNAVDKVVGDQLRAGALPAHDRILLVSGRASFELVQKALMAGIAVLAAVGAPSSLAVELAKAESMTVLGFVRDGRFNVYAGEERLDEASSPSRG